MTQEVYVAHADGAVLASDSLIIREDEAGRRERLTQRKLFALGTRAAIVSGGAAIGIDLSRQLAHAVASRGLNEIGEIIAFAPDFLRQGYSAYVDATRQWYAGHPGAYQRLYFLIAGCAADGLAQALLLGSEQISVPLTPLPVQRVVSMPRRLMLEVQLSRLAGRISLPELADYVLRQLALLAQKESETVGGPFDAVIITPHGMRPALLNAR